MTYEYKSQELYARREDHQIYGVIYIPEGAGEKMPAVIFSHGFGGNYQVGIPYAQALARGVTWSTVSTSAEDPREAKVTALRWKCPYVFSLDGSGAGLFRAADRL